MSSPAGSAATPRSGVPKTVKIGVGLALSLVGIAVLSLLLPTAPGALGSVLAVAGAGIVLVWVGGILMGIGSRS